MASRPDLAGAASTDRPLTRAFYARDPLVVAPELLNKVLVHGRRAGRIVEVEAYRGADDPASHAHRGQTPRTEVMFGPAGHLYVYFTYGMHWCANAVTSEDGVAGAVLIRALAPLRAIDDMAAARPRARRPVDIANGPAKACQAMGIDGTFDGIDLVRGDRGVTIVDDGTAAPARPTTGPRVGISVATERPWRYSVPGDPHRSKPW
ncbi:DNA-3-methyladenine glycosylase [Aquihabitans sp. McL0605]|uniref:DNA-3-methyladenine glycosylase n=1 Tax=Aquihabitans sp. McL0605 TaxID=3415671 RepID=UPI003CF49F51